MVIENNIPPVTVNDSVRIAKGIAAAGFPSAGIITAAMFLVLPWPWPIVCGMATIGAVFIAFVTALTKERDEFHKINRARVAQTALIERRAQKHDMRMKEIGYQAGMRVWEAEKLMQLGLPAPTSVNPVPPGPDRIITDYTAELPSGNSADDDDDEPRDDEGLILPKFVREGGANSKRMVRSDENTLQRSQRVTKLARHIRNFCADRNPSQDNILERIPMIPSGLIRSHEDITQALDLLAVKFEGKTYGWVTERSGRGTPRLWIDHQTGLPVNKNVRARETAGTTTPLVNGRGIR